MKKIIISISVVLASIIIVSFRPNKNKGNNETVITVTADKQTTFEMFQNDKVTKGLVTPYELKFNSDLGKFVFKASDNSILHVHLTNRNSKLSANMVVTVILMTNETIETFGID